MNKLCKILIFISFFILLPIHSNAEEVTCEYSAKMDIGDLLHPETIYIDVKVIYDENNLEGVISYTGTKKDYDTKFDFTHEDFMELVNLNSGSAKCPYTLPGAISNGRSWGYVIVVGKTKVDNLTFGCTNCDVGDMPIFNPGEYDDCEGILGPELISFINTIFDYVKVLVPVALIALGSFDIGRAVFAGNEDEMKKATKTFIRRLIIAVIIMFSPLLVNFIINVVNNATGTGYSGTCGIN